MARLTRRQLLKYGLAGLKGIGGLALIAEIGYQEYVFRQVRTFGTRENPVYTITAKMPDIEIDTYESFIQTWNNHLDSRLERLRSTQVPEPETKTKKREE